MVKKKLQSGFELNGVGPNILLQHVDHTAPFIFKNEIDTTLPNRAYLTKLQFYKKNLKQLQHISLSDYFYLCCCAHWATAGTYVPTNVDNQIREGLWNHQQIQSHIEKMTNITIDSRHWDYSPVTNRKIDNLSTHEGTWLSVAIGNWCAVKKHTKNSLQEKIETEILDEIKKEEKLLLTLREKRDHLNFLKTTALLAHNLGDLDRVMDQWELPSDDPFRKKIYKLGHFLNENYSPILVFAGDVNKEFCAIENHRHMSLRQPKCLRRSADFLVPIGPFYGCVGRKLAKSQRLTLEEKAEIVIALFDGYKRQDKAFGYIRAFRGLINSLPDQFQTLEKYIPYDLFAEIKKSKFWEAHKIEQELFEVDYKTRLEKFRSPKTDFTF
ncbi:MAG: hypothetical protein U0T83_02570 [Bacteriovoracaceae bacterium]